MRSGCSTRPEFVVTLAGVYGAKLNEIGMFNQTPLSLAVVARHVEAVQVLLDAGADPRIVMSERGQSFTALDLARNAYARADGAKKESYGKIIALLDKATFGRRLPCGPLGRRGAGHRGRARGP